jgi:hypothetical protein
MQVYDVVIMLMCGERERESEERERRERERKERKKEIFF